MFFFLYPSLGVRSSDGVPSPFSPAPSPLPQDEKEFQEAKGFDLKVLFELDPSPARLTWLMNYMDFMASRGTPLTHCPAMYKVSQNLVARI